MSTRKSFSSRDRRSHQQRSKKKSPNQKIRRIYRYSRQTDCWNCGQKDHRKENCPLPGALKCSFCLRDGVRSDRCPCDRKRSIGNAQRLHPSQTKTETSIIVFMFNKAIRAILNPYTQETMISEALLKFVEHETGNRAKKVVSRLPNGLRLVSQIVMEINTRQSNRKTVNGVLNSSITGYTMVLGMQAITTLGFRF